MTDGEEERGGAGKVFEEMTAKRTECHLEGNGTE